MVNDFNFLLIFILFWIVVTAPFMFLAMWLLKPIKGQRFDFATWFYLGVVVSMLCNELMGDDLGGFCTFVLAVTVAWIKLPVWTGEKLGTK